VEEGTYQLTVLTAHETFSGDSDCQFDVTG